jgi:hypothetical protein
MAEKLSDQEESFMDQEREQNEIVSETLIIPIKEDVIYMMKEDVNEKYHEMFEALKARKKAKKIDSEKYKRRRDRMLSDYEKQLNATEKDGTREYMHQKAEYRQKQNNQSAAKAQVLLIKDTMKKLKSILEYTQGIENALRIMTVRAKLVVSTSGNEHVKRIAIQFTGTARHPAHKEIIIPSPIRENRLSGMLWVLISEYRSTNSGSLMRSFRDIFEKRQHAPKNTDDNVMLSYQEAEDREKQTTSIGPLLWSKLFT